MIVQHNIPAMNASRQLKISGGSLSKATEKLSSGYKINRAGDDAAGLSISEKMRAQIRGLDQASTNSQNGISLIQTAEGALNETHSILQRMRELAVQAASDTNTTDDRTKIQDEINQLTTEVDRIANTTEFNTKKLLNGEQAGATEASKGTIKAEGNFANGQVKVTVPKPPSGGFAVNDTDVIRITVGKSASGTGTGAVNASGLKADSLYGGSGVTINWAKGEITLENITGGNPIVIKISGANKLTVGDTITISLNEQVKPGKASGTNSDGIKLQIGANAGQEMQMRIRSMKSEDLRISKSGKAFDISSQTQASMAIEAYDMAIQKVSRERAKMGAVQNRLEHTIANLDTASENLQASESRIRDTDMAKTMSEYSKNNILQQAGQSMLAQANQSTQGVLTLLR